MLPTNGHFRFRFHFRSRFRDFIHWLSCREVHRDAIDLALNNNESILLIPGGKTEIISSSSWSKEVVVYKGQWH